MTESTSKNNEVHIMKEFIKNPYYHGMKSGMTLKQCDMIARRFNYPLETKERVWMAAHTVMKSIESRGDIYTPLDEYLARTQEILRPEGSSFSISSKMIVSMLGNDFEIIRLHGRQVVYRKSLEDIERRVAFNIKRLAYSDGVENYNAGLLSYVEKKCGIKLGVQQRNAVATILRRRGVKILTGGPGTGKTTIEKAIITAYKKMHPEHTIRLCAPTGRAAQKMGEATGEYSETIHRLIGYKSKDRITYNRRNPIPADLIIVDEVSMVDIELMDHLLDALKTGTLLVLVGDIDQLESVGPGAVLRDIVFSDVHYLKKICLTEVFRQKEGSPIIENAVKINKGDINLIENEAFQIIHTKSKEQTISATLSIGQSLYNYQNPFETQILCPAYSGVSGIDTINAHMQSFIQGKDCNSFLVNDKVMFNKNNYLKEYYNGDIGIIKETAGDMIRISMRGTEIVIDKNNIGDIQLAYGMTIHKSQGSEFQNVIIVMPMEPANMLVRNLFYTGVTRAKSRVIIINEGSAMETAIKTDKSGERKTFLRQLII